MGKLDTSTGLSAKEIGAFKFQIKHEIRCRLPELPDPVETQLFLQGRYAWTYAWKSLNTTIPIGENDIVYIEVIAKLKKEFHDYLEKKQFRYRCKIQRQEDMYHPQLSVTEIIS